ncbi:hypothetical protein FOZ62_029408, partial [Perkinsus olseni]
RFVAAGHTRIVAKFCTLIGWQYPLGWLRSAVEPGAWKSLWRPSASGRKGRSD